jgi:hypothetical protein
LADGNYEFVSLGFVYGTKIFLAGRILMASLKDVVFKLRDVEADMTTAWNEAFHSIRTDCNIEVSIRIILHKLQH